MRESQATANKPHDPPRLPAHISLTAKQRIGLPFLALVPILALLGIFGEHQATVVAQSNGVDVTVTYPSRLRYRQVQPLRVSIRNRRSTFLDGAVVSFDTAYISRFSAVQFSPAVASDYIVPVSRIVAGAAALVTIELSGDQYWRHYGRIVVVVNGDSLRVPISTFVFP